MTVAAGRRPTWRAADTFRAALLVSFVVATAAMAAAGWLRVQGGPLTEVEATRLLAVLYWGVYPAAFVAFGALFWHLVRSYRGDYATR